jgi:hypothetical protein
MFGKQRYLDRANNIMKMLKNENIRSEGDKIFWKQLDTIRIVTFDIANQSKIIAPALTSCVASTLLKFGLCQELAQRFVLEYCIKYKEKNISQIFMVNFENDAKNHALVYISDSPFEVPELMFEANNGCLNTRKASYTIDKLLSENNSGIFADPFLNCIGNSKNELAPLLRYCTEKSITHVGSIKSYFDTPFLVENASRIKENATEIANRIKGNFTYKALLATPPSPSSAHSFFNQEDINSLIKKYNLPDNSQESLEKGLRNAATNDKYDDLKIFIKHVKNIDAQDSNPKVRRTALHWAAIKKHDRCYQLLLASGAKDNISDANGESAANYSNTAALTKNI